MFIGIIVLCAGLTPMHECTPKGNYLMLSVDIAKPFNSLSACVSAKVREAEDMEMPDGSYAKVYCMENAL
jgi:hypothetical protein